MRFNPKKGLTLVELLIAMVLLIVVLLTASSVLISFKKFYTDFTRKQSDVNEIASGALQEIAGRIRLANRVDIISASRIDIWVDNTDSAVNTDDTIYSYWLDGNSIKYKYKVGGNPYSPEKEIVKNVGLLTFELLPAANPPVNQIRINIGALLGGGLQEIFQTTIVARAEAAAQY